MFVMKILILQMKKKSTKAAKASAACGASIDVCDSPTENPPRQLGWIFFCERRNYTSATAVP
jgi:hypothetical protein